MGDNIGAFEEGGRSNPLGSIDDLVRDDEVAWSDLLPKRSNSAECNYCFYANRGECGDIRSRRNSGWIDRVRDTMARKERNLGPI